MEMKERCWKERCHRGKKGPKEETIVSDVDQVGKATYVSLADLFT